MESDRKLEGYLGYQFYNKKLLATALTHPSYRYEKTDVKEDNQRLEFLGDAALGLIAASYLFTTFPHLPEGELTRLRSQLANKNMLGKIAAQIDLGQFIQLGQGEKRSGGSRRLSTLADTMEAIIGAAYLDNGMMAVQTIFHILFIPMFQSLYKEGSEDNPKGTLQEIMQKDRKTSPTYQLISEEGPAHARKFIVEVAVEGQTLARGEGPNKKAAEREAAERAMAHLNPNSERNG